MTKTEIADERRELSLIAQANVWDMKVRERMSDAEVFDRMVAYWNGHWRDKYVHLLPHMEEIKELTK